MKENSWISSIVKIEKKSKKEFGICWICKDPIINHLDYVFKPKSNLLEIAHRECFRKIYGDD